MAESGRCVVEPAGFLTSAYLVAVDEFTHQATPPNALWLDVQPISAVNLQ